jgi:hypothetical protein
LPAGFIGTKLSAVFGGNSDSVYKIGYIKQKSEGENLNDPHGHDVTESTSAHTHSADADFAGGSSSFDNRPAYTALYYIYRAE